MEYNNLEADEVYMISNWNEKQCWGSPKTQSVFPITFKVIWENFDLPDDELIKK
jgi:hypothetical protein